MIRAIFDLLKASLMTKKQREKQDREIAKRIVTNKIGNHITQEEHEENRKRVLKMKF